MIGQRGAITTKRDCPRTMALLMPLRTVSAEQADLTRQCQTVRECETVAVSRI